MGLITKTTRSTSDTFNTDARVVGGDDSRNYSLGGTGHTVGSSGNTQSIKFNIKGKGNTVTTTDFGAVSGSLALALQGVEGAQTIAREAQAASGGLLEGALRMSGEQQKQFTDVIEKIKTSDVRTLIITGMAVMGLAAVMYFRKG
jgi:hypothetical protein